jgi:hypothetical protein
MKTTYTMNPARANETVAVDIDWSKLSDEVKAYIIEYGLKQSMADRAAKHTKDMYETEAEWAKAGVEAMQEFLEGLKAGAVPTSGGGRTSNPLTLALRELMETKLKTAGLKAVEAKKKAKAPESALQFLIRAALAQKTGVKFDDVPTEDVMAAFEPNWEKTVASARAIVEMKSGMDLDI